MTWLESIDHWLVLTINGLHNPFLDQFFWFISARLTWIPFYLLLIYLYWRKSRQLVSSFFFVLLAILCVALADVISAQGFKEFFQRYRPSHHQELSQKLHFYRFNGELYRGGQYGFVSSHAANFGALLMWCGLHLRKVYSRITWYFLGVFILVVLSRIYLGVHYPSDVIAGGILGSLIAYLIFRLSKRKLILEAK